MNCILINLLTDGKIKFLRHKKQNKKINHQQTCTIRNVKGSPLGRRKILPHGNLDLQRGMKNTKNGKYVGK